MSSPWILGPTDAEPLAAVAPEFVLGRHDIDVVDLRAPKEYAIDRVPCARNVPLFDDDERALIGTLYRQSAPDDAYAAAREIARRRLPDLVRELTRGQRAVPAGEVLSCFERLSRLGLAPLDRALSVAALPGLPARSLVLYCWRGGLRSRSVTALLRGIGMENAVCLEGGYKRYRTSVIDTIERWVAPRVFVLRGLTGVGKSVVLREIERLLPRSTLDLELLAGHRSSILGMVGLEPCSQKQFESRLAERLRQGTLEALFVEGESRKVGDAIVPARVWKAMEGAVNVELVAGIERRIEVLKADYLASAHSRDQLRGQLRFFDRLSGFPATAAELGAMLDSGRETQLARLLLERYYDPLYRHSEQGRAHALTIDAEDPVRAARKVLEFAQTARATAAGEPMLRSASPAAARGSPAPFAAFAAQS